MIQECERILAIGKKCCAPALNGKRFCRHHAPSRKRRVPRPYTRQSCLLGLLPQLNNSEAVHTTISRVIQALADDSISVYRAQTLITSLQLASKTLRSR